MSTPYKPMNTTQRRNTRIYLESALEHGEQQALITRARLSAGARPEMRLLFAIPNGGARSKADAGKLKAEGVLAGVPDLMLPVARDGWHGLFIELKRPKGGTTSTEQSTMHRDLWDQGYCVVTCPGQDAAWNAMIAYLDNRLRAMAIDRTGETS